MYDVTYCLCFGGSRPIPILSKRWHLLQYHLIYPCNLHIMVLALYRDCYWIPTSWIFLSNKSNLILFCDTYNGKYLHSRHFLSFPIFNIITCKDTRIHISNFTVIPIDKQITQIHKIYLRVLRLHCPFAIIIHKKYSTFSHVIP